MAFYVNGRKIEEEDIQAEMDRLRVEYEKAAVDVEPEAQAKQLYEWSRENIVERILIEQAAEKELAIPDDEIEHAYRTLLDQNGGEERFFKNVDDPAEKEKNFKVDIAKRLRIEKFIRQVAAQAKSPTEKEVLEYYEQNSEKYTAPEMVRASHVVKHLKPDSDSQKVYQEMEELYKEICGESNFEEVASRNSDCPENAGDLGYFPRGQMVQEFEDIIFEMKVGQVSSIFQTEFGFHIAKLIDKKPATLCPLADIKDAVTKALTQEYQQREVEKFIDSEKEKSVLEEKE